MADDYYEPNGINSNECDRGELVTGWECGCIESLHIYIYIVLCSEFYYTKKTNNNTDINLFLFKIKLIFKVIVNVLTVNGRAIYSKAEFLIKRFANVNFDAVDLLIKTFVKFHRWECVEKCCGPLSNIHIK